MTSSAKKRNISQRSEMIYDVHHFGIILDSRELWITPSAEGEIDADTAERFSKNVQTLNSYGADPILVHVMSCGGSYDYGMAIYDTIKANCDDPELADIVTLSYAHARSMSSVIPQAATWRVIRPHAYFMIHDGEYANEGTLKTVWSDLEFYKRVGSAAMMDVYVEKVKEGDFVKRQGWDEKQLRAEIEQRVAYKDDWFLTAREAVDWGFMDAVLGDDGFDTLKKLREEEEE